MAVTENIGSQESKNFNSFSIIRIDNNSFKVLV